MWGSLICLNFTYYFKHKSVAFSPSIALNFRCYYLFSCPFVGWWRATKNGWKWHGKYVFGVGRLMGESATKSGLRNAKIGAKWERKSGHNHDEKAITAVTRDSGQSRPWLLRLTAVTGNSRESRPWLPKTHGRDSPSEETNLFVGKGCFGGSFKDIWGHFLPQLY